MLIEQKGDRSIAIGFDAKLIGSWRQLPLAPPDTLDFRYDIFGTSHHMIVAMKEVLLV
jgi:hypothetical protein